MVEHARRSVVVGKPLLTYLLHKILAVLLAIVTESIPHIEDLDKLEVDLLVGVIRPIQALGAIRLSVHLLPTV